MENNSPLTDSPSQPIPRASCPSLPELAILCSSKNIAEQLVRRSEQFATSEVTHFELLGIVQVRCFDKSAICSPVFGAPLAAALIEHLVNGGVKKLLYLGSCGALPSSNKELSVGDICLPKFVRAEDGTSRLYQLPKRFENNSALQDKLMETIAEESQLKQITLFSTDAPYLETEDKVNELTRLGIDAIELEFAACCALAFHHNLEVAGAFVTSDILKQPWTSGFRSKEFQSSMKKLVGAISNLAFT